MLGGLFPRTAPTDQGPPQPDNPDAGAIASRVAEQIGNVRAASQSERTTASSEEASKPPETRSIQENADGTFNITIKNARSKDPVSTVNERANAPYADFVTHVLNQGSALGQHAAGEVDKTAATMDSSLSSREGRAKLLADVGVENPRDVPGRFMQLGLAKFRGETHAYEKLLADPERVRMLVMSKKFGEVEGVAKDLKPFADTQRQGSIEERRLSGEERRQDNQERLNYGSFISTLKSFDASNDTSVDDYVKFAHNLADRSGVPWDDSLEHIARAKYGADVRTKAVADAREKKIELETKLKDEKSDDERKLLRRQIENLDSLINARDNKKSKLGKGFASRMPASDLVTYIGNEDYDQQSVREAVQSKTDSLRLERQRLEAQLVGDRAKIRVLDDKSPTWQGYTNSGDPEQLAIARSRSIIAQQRLHEIEQEENVLSDARHLTGGEGPAPPPAAPPPPPKATPKNSGKGKPRGTVVNQGGQLVYYQGR